MSQINISNLDKFARQFQVTVARKTDHTKVDPKNLSKQWAMDLGFPEDEALQLSNYIENTHQSFRNEGPPTYVCGIENGELWTIEVEGKRPQVENHNTAAEALKACDEFIEEAADEGLEYECDELVIFENANAGSIRRQMDYEELISLVAMESLDPAALLTFADVERAAGKAFSI